MMRKSSDLLDQILTNGPSQSTILLILTAMKEEGWTSEVIQGCIKSLDNYPGDIHLRKLLAESYQEVGFIGRAEEELTRVTSEIDDLSSAYKLQARIYAQQERLDESFESLKRYLVLNPDDREGLDLLAKIKPAEPEIESEGIPVDEEPLPEMDVPEPETEPEPELLEAEPAIEIPEAEPEPEEQTPVEEGAQTEATEEEQEDPVVDLATPTLAELYFSQGQIPEAVNTYEKILLDNPDDKASEQRLAELKASISQEAKPLPSKEEVAGIKTEKTIAILENWLNSIQTMDNG
ncbi:MAG: tetratricopeptide repeat protein [Deltaproteobacteria bacterium]|nr:tetratricopeptide repeat protein [Deltaproteobacteria bacterium]